MRTRNRLLLAALVAGIGWRARSRLQALIAGARRLLPGRNGVAGDGRLERPRGVPALSFEPLTPLYDALTTVMGYGSSFTAKVLDAAAMRDSEVLLDVGAGTGSLLLLAKRRYPSSRVIGIEPDARMVQRARDKIERADLEVELIPAGAEALPLPAASVDLVVSSLVFHHLPLAAKVEAVTEIRRVLKPGGRFLLADFGPPDTPWPRIFFALVRILRVPEASTLRDNVEGKLPDILAEAGFRVQEVGPSYRGIRFLRAIPPGAQEQRLVEPKVPARANPQHMDRAGDGE